MKGLSRRQQYTKRFFDFSLSAVGIIIVFPILISGLVAAAISTGSSGLFLQTRVGRKGKLFTVIKLRTMRNITGTGTTVTAASDPRITKVGNILRVTKIDELPQLFNVLNGSMSFVGPRPDVPGFADALEGEDRALLQVRPGITGPASLYFRNEEILLSKVRDPETFNREIIWPKKVSLNLQYIKNYSLFKDFVLVFQTLVGRGELCDLNGDLELDSFKKS